MKKYLVFLFASLMLYSCGDTTYVDTPPTQQFTGSNGQQMVVVHDRDYGDMFFEMAMFNAMMNSGGGYRSVREYHHHHYNEPSYRSNYSTYSSSYQSSRNSGRVTDVNTSSYKPQKRIWFSGSSSSSSSSTPSKTTYSSGSSSTNSYRSSGSGSSSRSSGSSSYSKPSSSSSSSSYSRSSSRPSSRK